MPNDPLQLAQAVVHAHQVQAKAIAAFEASGQHLARPQTDLRTTISALQTTLNAVCDDVPREFQHAGYRFREDDDGVLVVSPPPGDLPTLEQLLPGHVLEGAP